MAAKEKWNKFSNVLDSMDNSEISGRREHKISPTSLGTNCSKSERNTTVKGP